MFENKKKIRHLYNPLKMFSFHKFQQKILMHWMTYQNQAKISKKWSNKNICRVIGNLYKISSPTECRNIFLWGFFGIQEIDASLFKFRY